MLATLRAATRCLSRSFSWRSSGFSRLVLAEDLKLDMTAASIGKVVEEAVG